jgi:predicted RNA-binding Zn-ribbon protein involved in translation (DUF1610 family)
MSRFNELLHGDADHAADILGDGMPRVAEQRAEELRCALINALRRIGRLEARQIWTCPMCGKVQDNVLRCTGCGHNNGDRKT